MTIQEAMSLECLASAELLAGENNLQNEITSVVILESDDIDRWGRKGQLLLTSYFALQDLPPDALTSFFLSARAIGISGIVLKLERLVFQVPDDMLQLCEAYQIPLLMVPGDVPYESIISGILSNLVESNYALLNHFYEIHNQMMTYALERPTIVDVLKFVKNTIGMDVTFLAEYSGTRTGTSPRASAFTAFSYLEPAPGEYRHYDYRVYRLTYSNGAEAEALCVNVPTDGAEHHYLFIHTGGQELSAFHTIVIENAVSHLQTHLLAEQEVRQQLFFHANSTMNELLTNQYLSGSERDSYLQELDLLNGPRYQCLHIRVLFRDPDNFSLSRWISAFRKELRPLCPHSAYMSSNDKISFLLNFAAPSRCIESADVNNILDVLSGMKQFSGLTYSAALSEALSADELPAIYQQARDVLHFYEGTDRQDICCSYKDLGIYKLFLGNRDPAMLQQYLDPRVQRLRRDDPELFATLVQLCENNLNINRTAKEMFVHAKTISYRISRADERYQLNVHHVDDFLQLVFADRLYRLLERKN